MGFSMLVSMGWCMVPLYGLHHVGLGLGSSYGYSGWPGRWSWLENGNGIC